MGLVEVVIAIVVVGGPTWVVSKFIDSATGGRRKQAQLEAQVARDRVRTLEARLVDAHRQSEQLQQQLDWHSRLLATQDRLLEQLADRQTRPAAEGGCG
jgi:hypothetical protein